MVSADFWLASARVVSRDEGIVGSAMLRSAGSRWCGAAVFGRMILITMHSTPRKTRARRSASAHPRTRSVAPRLLQKSMTDLLSAIDCLACMLWMSDGCHANSLDGYRQEVALQLCSDDDGWPDWPMQSCGRRRNRIQAAAQLYVARTAAVSVHA
jgi:hypothetical protein